LWPAGFVEAAHVLNKEVDSLLRLVVHDVLRDRLALSECQRFHLVKVPAVGVEAALIITDPVALCVCCDWLEDQTALATLLQVA
jgi:hypothetical protein